MQRLDIAGHDQRNAPLDVLAAQPDVDQILARAADHDGDMPRGEERVAFFQPVAGGMAAAHRERIAVGIEKLAVKTLEAVADRASRDRWCGRIPAVMIAELRHGTTSMVTFGASFVTFSISGGINSSTARSGIIRRKCRSLRAASNSSRVNRPRTWSSACASGPRKRLRPRRQLHPRAGAHQQGIADQVAQPLQRVARRRLRQADPHRGAADAGFAAAARRARPAD